MYVNTNNLSYFVRLPKSRYSATFDFITLARGNFESDSTLVEHWLFKPLYGNDFVGFEPD